MPRENFGDRFNSFQDLGKLKQNPTSSATLQGGKTTDDPTRERFNLILKDKLGNVPAANYKTELSGVDSMTVNHPLQGNGFLGVTLLYRANSLRERKASFQLLNSGVLSGDKIPAELSDLSKEDIIAEILRVAESIDVGAWHKLDLNVFPEADERGALSNEPNESSENEGYEKYAVDPERLKFLSSQKGFLAGVMSRDWGFKSSGYQIAILPNCIILENNEVGNAAFVVKLSDPVMLNDEMKSKLVNGKVTNKEDADSLARMYLRPILQRAKTRKELMESYDAVRIEHRGDWQSKMQNTITQYEQAA